MWIWGPVLRNPIWDMIFPDNSTEIARRAIEEAAMWRNLFFLAVVVIVVQAFVIWRKYHRKT